MEAYAVVETGGKQYMISEGSVLKIEHIEAEPGASIEISPVLAVSDGATLRVGKRILDDVKVTASVVAQTRARKVVSFKKRRRKGYKRKIGHRQMQTTVRIEAIK